MTDLNHGLKREFRINGESELKAGSGECALYVRGVTVGLTRSR